MLIAIIVLAVLFLLHIIVPLIYYTLMARIAEKKPWSLSLNANYQPKITLIISTFNESSIIVERLNDLKKTDYPPEKFEVIIVDSASPDGTAKIAKDYISAHPFPFKISVLEEQERRGKAKALNMALNHANGDVIATSDADSFLDPSALKTAIQFLSSREVGAVTGREMITNIGQNVYTLGEGYYGRINRTIRLGESKINSTLIFQGELSLYKREAFLQFEDKKGSDDIGTVINIVSAGYRTIFIPNAVFYDAAHHSFKGRMTVKIRRAQHLIYGIIKAIRLKLKRKISIPPSIVFMNFYLYVLNPILSFLLVTDLVYLAINFPILLVFLPLILIPKRLRVIFILYVTSNLALLLAILRCIRGDKQIAWKKIDETRYNRAFKKDN